MLYSARIPDKLVTDSPDGGPSMHEDERVRKSYSVLMDKTYVFSNEPSSGCCGSKLDITALLPNLMGGRSLDPNLLLALNNGYRNQDMWGGAGMWWIWILLLFGWGRNGFSGWGGGCNDGCCGNGAATFNALPWALNGDAGRELLMNAIQGNGNAIQQLATTLNCDVKSIESNLCNIQSLIQGVGNQVGLTSQQVINSIQSVGCSIGSQLAQCCCDLKQGIERQGYENRIATINQTDDIKADANTKFNILSSKIDAQSQLLSDKFCALEKRELQNKIDALRDERTALQTSALLQQQSRTIIDTVRPCPIPSFSVCNPWSGNGGFYGYGYGYPYGYNNGCGCNNGCGSGCGC